MASFGYTDMHITPATRADIPVLTRLLNELFTQEEEFSPDPVLQTRGLEMILAQPQQGILLVAREEGMPIGMLSLLYTVSPALGARVALLEDFVVTKAARGQGVGSALLASAIGHARAAGCQRITLLTDGDNQGAQALYARHGFRASDMLPMRLGIC